ncbi:MAG: PAS domain-containing protein [Gammaproteobacteria bacterium]|nr:PAS domain-containing protein [Gammaproteobacteria bacterium]
MMKDDDHIEFELYKQMIEKMPIHIYCKDKHLKYLNCNLSQATDLGFKSEASIIGKTDYDLFSKNCADQIRKNDLEVMTTKKAHLFEESTDDHKTLVFLTQKIPLFNKKGEVIGVGGVSFNISERKALEKQMMDKKEDIERTLASIIDNLPGHVYWKNKDSVYQGCNHAQLKSAGFSNQNEMIGKTDYDMPWKNQADILRESDLAVMSGGETLTREETSKLANSDQISVFLSKKTPIYNKSGEVSGILGISFDITDRKHMEQDLLTAKDKAELANQAKSDFISNMEHDLRTPFTGIRGVASLLYESETDPEKKSLMEIMMQSCQQWETVHNRIFDALVAEHETPLEIEDVSIRQELTEIQEMMAATLHIKQLDYITSPIPDTINMIKTDKLKFRLILSSLISNAIKFTEKGMVTVNVSHEANHCVISVVDTGIGIPADKFDYIFEKFTKLSRSNTHASDFQGVGLGLCIAKQYATQLGGAIQVESKLGEGSTFTVRLPVPHGVLE